MNHSCSIYWFYCCPKISANLFQGLLGGGGMEQVTHSGKKVQIIDWNNAGEWEENWKTLHTHLGKKNYKCENQHGVDFFA